MEADLNKFSQYLQSKRRYSQLGQDLFVNFILDEKRNGYFVEFGAADGIEKSNSYLLEKDYAWKGILCEPAKSYQDALKKNRSCIKDLRCVYTNTGSNIKFRDCSFGEISCIDSYSNNDSWAQTRRNGITYDVETVSLKDLLIHHNAPQTIDYLSIDTEGSEFDILNSFDFSYHINIITAEHNHTDNKDKVIELLAKHNFIHVFSSITDFDSWFINEEIRTIL